MIFPWFSQPFPHGPKAHRLQHPRSQLRPLPQSKQHRNLWDERETHGDSWGVFRDFSGILVGCLVGFHWYLTDSHYIYIYIYGFYMVLYDFMKKTQVSMGVWKREFAGRFLWYQKIKKFNDRLVFERDNFLQFQPCFVSIYWHFQYVFHKCGQLIASGQWAFASSLGPCYPQARSDISTRIWNHQG